jgi:hypothetical protein
MALLAFSGKFASLFFLKIKIIPAPFNLKNEKNSKTRPVQ